MKLSKPMATVTRLAKVRYNFVISCPLNLSIQCQIIGSKVLGTQGHRCICMVIT